MFWWNEIKNLKRHVKTLEAELEKETSKTVRLGGFLERLLSFGITPTGQVPRRAYADTLIDSVATLLRAEEVILFETDPSTLDLIPVASRGFAPEVLARRRVAMEDSGSLDFVSAPSMVAPLISRGQSVGLLLAAKPREGTFDPEARSLIRLFASQAALTFEDYVGYEAQGRLAKEAVQALLRAIETKDVYTHHHSDRTRSLVRAFTEAIPLPEPLIQDIEYGVFLHDVGKIGIEDAILGKPDKLTPQEYEVMKRHPAIGHRILEPMASLNQVASIVLYHQEWYNGQGYPEGLAGEEIPFGARIVQIIDAWDAMTSDRPYRKAMPKNAAIAELRRAAGTQFDPKLVDIFLRIV